MKTIIPLKEYYYSKPLLTCGTKTHIVPERVTMLEIFDKEVLLFLLQQFCFVLI